MGRVLHDDGLIRREILRVLDINYPGKVNLTTISLVLMREGYVLADQEIRQHLAYMTDKGYARFEDLKNSVLGRATVAEITAKGKDLIAGDIDADPGIHTIVT